PASWLANLVFRIVQLFYRLHGRVLQHHEDTAHDDVRFRERNDRRAFDGVGEVGDRDICPPGLEHHDTSGTVHDDELRLHLERRGNQVGDVDIVPNRLPIRPKGTVGWITRDRRNAEDAALDNFTEDARLLTISWDCAQCGGNEQ